MYKICIEQHFDAAHALRGYKGKCEALHGHRFRVVVKVTAFKLDDIGLAYDFTQLKARLKSILKRFDHTNLNDIPPFMKINPSSENIASTIYGEMQAVLKEVPVELDTVEVWESPNSGVEYRMG
jgi:6-pyruvoyltetrahydropterin/6-carboxytetrahydropterin synthase